MTRARAKRRTCPAIAHSIHERSRTCPAEAHSVNERRRTTIRVMRRGRCLPLVLLIASLAGCATKVQARTEIEMPVLDPPPAPPRVVAAGYPIEAEVVPLAPAVEAALPARPPARTPRPERPEPSQSIPEPVQDTSRAASTPSLTLTPSPGTETKTAAAIRDLMARAARDLARVNQGSLNADGRTQFDTARRFLQQADEALSARNVVFAGKLADKAATMAAVLVR